MLYPYTHTHPPPLRAKELSHPPFFSFSFYRAIKIYFFEDKFQHI